jgi:hypothetical protein
MKRLLSRAAMAASLGLMLLNTGCTAENLTLVNNLLKQSQQAGSVRAPGEASSGLPTGVQPEASQKPDYQPPRREYAPREEALVPVKPSAEATARPTAEPTAAPIVEPTAVPTPYPTHEPRPEPTAYPEPTPYPIVQESAPLCAREMLKIRFIQPADAPRRDWYGGVMVEQGHVYLMRQLHFIPENLAYGNPPEFSVVKWRLSPEDNYDGLMLMIDGQPAKAMPKITIRFGDQSKTLDFKQLSVLAARMPVGEAGHYIEFKGQMLPAGTCGPVEPAQEKMVYYPTETAPVKDSQSLDKGGVSDDGI